MGKFAKSFTALAVACIILFIGCLGVRIVKKVSYDLNCNSYLQRAASASDIDVAKVELGKALSYIEEHNLTQGNTSILLKNPMNDVTFWYNTLKDTYNQLENFPEDATVLEKSNFLIRMRESFIQIGVPNSISIYPNQLFYFWWTILSVAGAIVFFILRDIANKHDWA